MNFFKFISIDILVVIRKKYVFNKMYKKKTSKLLNKNVCKYLFFEE